MTTKIEYATEADRLYERHRQAVANWRQACEDVELAEQSRDAARGELDSIGQELLASCADSGKRQKPKAGIAKRGRPKSDKTNGVDVKALMREGPKGVVGKINAFGEIETQ